MKKLQKVTFENHIGDYLNVYWSKETDTYLQTMLTGASKQSFYIITEGQLKRLLFNGFHEDGSRDFEDYLKELIDDQQS